MGAATSRASGAPADLPPIDLPPVPSEAALDFAAYLEAARARVEAALEASLGPERPEELREAMRYSLLAGGKRLRPILCLAACELAGGDPQLALPTAVALRPLGSADAPSAAGGRSPA